MERTARRTVGRRGHAAVAPSRRPAARSGPAPSTHPMLRLQGQAGNHAVSSLVAPGVQRQRKTAGWTGADTSGDGWNVGAKENVEGSGVRRIPVDDVPVGNTMDFSDKVYVDKKGNKVYGRANEQAKTRESGARRAIVLKPAGLNVNIPIDVLLHLHGYTSRAWDPYAGWRQSRKATTKGTNKNYHAVRDVDQDRIAQQIGAAGNPQVLGILPQGVGHSQFGNLVPRTYVDAVFDRLEAINELKKPVSGQRQINLVLSGHSGAGHTISAALRAEVAAAKAAAKGKPTGKTPILAPVEVVLFEAINGPGELSAVTDWVDHHLNRVRAALLAAKTPADRAAAITSCPILRAYRSKSGYVAMYNRLDDHIKDWFAKPDNARVLGADTQRVRDRFKVEVLTGLIAGGHEKVVGGLGKAEEGPLADALMARRDPSASKLVRGGPPPTTAKPAKKQRRKRTKKAATTAPSGSAVTAKPVQAPKAAGAPVPTTTTAAATTAPVITFGSRARRDVVAASSLATVVDVLRTARLTKATITSTARTPTDQARAMYQNLAGKNSDARVEKQYKLYGAGGDKVIDTFVELRDRGLSAADIQDGMRRRILEIGPRTVSKHLADPATMNVLDISPASLGGGDAVARFEKAAQALVGSRIDRLLTPGQGDPAEHVELKPVGGGSPPAGAGPAATSAEVPAPTKPAKPAKPASEAKASPPAARPAAPPPRSAAAPTTATPTATGAPAAARRPPPGAAAPRTTPASAPGFITDITRSTLELLPRDQQERFSKIAWNDQDYPGAKHRIKDTSEENLNRWRADGGYILWKVEGKKGKPDVWWMKGAHQAEAQALLDALARVRPGGGERRANTGTHAILTKAQYKGDPDAFDEYIIGQLVDPEGVTKRGDYTMMNKHAAEKFVEMRTAAAADGVTLSIGNAFRPRAVAEASAKKKDNPKAVASYSAHSLGLAVDLNLSTRRLKVKETTTAMTNTVKALSTSAYKWMFMRGGEFGFYQFRMEPWHWEYNPAGFADTFWADDPSLAPSATPAAPAKSARR